jgi:PH (Pleckstrin Homology) domain-containing protein/putative oligomerization/nucleic acid binding protein
VPTLEEVREQIGHMDGGSKFLGRKEIKALPDILWEDERVEQLIQGTYENGTGVLVATNKRLMFVDKGIAKLRVEDFPYDKISSIQYKTGMMMGTITIFASGNKAEIKNVVKERCKNFADYIRARSTAISEHASTSAAGSTAQPAPTADDVVTQLERLARLREQGVLTDAEFEAQKQKILS